MFAEIKKVTHYLMTEKKYADLRKKILFIFLAFVILILINRFVLTNLADKGEFYVSLARTKMVFQGNISAYGTEINRSSETIKQLGITLGEVKPFNLPLYALLFYLPFAYISDFNWALALWISANQLICYFIFNLILDILGWEIKEKYKIAGTLLISLAYFSTLNILSTNLSLLQILLLVLALDKVKTKEYIFSGILLGLATFNPFNLMLPMIVFILLNFAQHRGEINLWMMISVILLTLALVIFDMRWVLEILKVWLLQPDSYPLISYQKYIAGIFPQVNTNLINIFPLMIFLWLIYEWLRNPKENITQEFWLISLAFTLNPLLNMWDGIYSTIGYLVVFVYTVSLWYERSTPKFRIFIAILYGLVLLVIPATQMLLQKQILTYQGLYTFNLIVTVILLFNLYWVRLWVMNPYYSVNKTDDF